MKFEQYSEFVPEVFCKTMQKVQSNNLSEVLNEFKCTDNQQIATILNSEPRLVALLKTVSAQLNKRYPKVQFKLALPFDQESLFLQFNDAKNRLREQTKDDLLYFAYLTESGMPEDDVAYISQFLGVHIISGSNDLPI